MRICFDENPCDFFETGLPVIPGTYGCINIGPWEQMYQGFSLEKSGDQQSAPDTVIIPVRTLDPK